MKSWGDEVNKPIALVDLEGVLFPEMWPNIAAEIDEKRLAVTTREVADYDALMTQRLAILKSCSVTLSQIQNIVAKLAHLQGAHEFIECLQEFYEVTIVTDSFAPMNDCALASINAEHVFTNHLVVDNEGYAAECLYWHIGQGKERVFEFLPKGRTTLAIDDGLNDLGMLRRADLGILFNPSEKTRSAGRGLTVMSELDQVIQCFANFTSSTHNRTPFL